MSDIRTESKKDGRFDFIKEHRKLYIRSGGTEGHILDVTRSGGHTFGTHCLIRYKGRKSGKTMITPLCYGDIGGEVVIVASLGGAPKSPQWYENIRSAETVDFQIATQAFRANWREPEGAEREKVWNFMVDCFPFYADYQQRTTRVIPLIMMKLIEPIPVFTEDDLD